jgi:hypothetical protein
MNKPELYIYENQAATDILCELCGLCEKKMATHFQKML